MKRFFKVLVLAITVFSLFAGCASSSSNIDSQYENNDINNETESTETEALFSMSKTKTNQQIKADSVLDRQISGTQYFLFNYSFTNGNECVDTVYVFNTDPDTLVENDAEAYDNNFLKKYSYLYLNGEKDSDIQVQKYTRDDIEDAPWYRDQYYYIKSSEHKDKLQAYHSYEIGTSGTVYDNEYFYYSYDDNGLLTDIMDELGDKNYFYYDEKGILKSRTFDAAESNYNEKLYSYESKDGNVVKVYVHNAENGNTISRYEYEYDSSNRIIKEVAYSYYQNEEKRINNTTSYSYNENGNISKIIEEKYDSDTDSYKTTSKEYSYNDNNDINKIVADNGKSVEYTVFVYSKNPNSYIEENG